MMRPGRAFHVEHVPCDTGGSEAERSTWNVPVSELPMKLNLQRTRIGRPVKSLGPGRAFHVEQLLIGAPGETDCHAARENSGAGIVPRGTRSLRPHMFA
jgi:hypothetical protein